MNIFFVIAGVALLVFAVSWLVTSLFGKKGAKSVAAGETEPQNALVYIVGAAIIALVIIVFYRQILAAIGVNVEEPFVLSWVVNTIQSAFSGGGLPVLK